MGYLLVWSGFLILPCKFGSTPVLTTLWIVPSLHSDHVVRLSSASASTVVWLCSLTWWPLGRFAASQHSYLTHPTQLTRKSFPHLNHNTQLPGEDIEHSLMHFLCLKNTSKIFHSEARRAHWFQVTLYYHLIREYQIQNGTPAFSTCLSP